MASDESAIASPALYYDSTEVTSDLADWHTLLNTKIQFSREALRTRTKALIAVVHDLEIGGSTSGAASTLFSLNLSHAYSVVPTHLIFVGATIDGASSITGGADYNAGWDADFDNWYSQGSNTAFAVAGSTGNLLQSDTGLHIVRPSGFSSQVETLATMQSDEDTEQYFKIWKDVALQNSVTWDFIAVLGSIVKIGQTT